VVRSGRGGGAAELAAARGNGHILSFILMSRTRKWIVLGLVLAAPILPVQSLLAQGVAARPAPAAPQPAAPATAAPTTAAPTTATPATTPHHKVHKTQNTLKPVELPPLPSGPLSQLPMDQIPATKAVVSYEGGLLTISAQNSTLGEILRDVRKLTGASIEIPQGSAVTERVVAHLGPGAPRDVMAVLLNGSSFDYVMLGSNSDPAAISSVVLLTKPSAADNQTAANGQGNPAGMPVNGRQPFGRPGIAGPGNRQAAIAQDDSKDDDSDSADDKDDDQAQPAQPAQPETVGANADANANGNSNVNGQDQPQPADPNQPNAGPKTPEQILEMLQRQKQQPGALPTPPQPPQQQ
jgi:hypothetical protein